MNKPPGLASLQLVPRLHRPAEAARHQVRAGTSNNLAIKLQQQLSDPLKAKPGPQIMVLSVREQALGFNTIRWRNHLGQVRLFQVRCTLSQKSGSCDLNQRTILKQLNSFEFGFKGLFQGQRKCLTQPFAFRTQHKVHFLLKTLLSRDGSKTIKPGAKKKYKTQDEQTTKFL